MSKNLKLQRIVMEVFGGCNYTCQMCPQTSPGRGKSFTRKMPLKEFERILDEIVPKHGTPQINLEGSGEPTMAKDLPEYVKAVKKRNLKYLLLNLAQVECFQALLLLLVVHLKYFPWVLSPTLIKLK